MARRYIGVYKDMGFMGWGNTYEEVYERAKQNYEQKQKQKNAGRITPWLR
jgi:hypothetical protein